MTGSRGYRNRPRSRCTHRPGTCGRPAGHQGGCEPPRIDQLIRDQAREVVAAYDIADRLEQEIDKLRALLDRVPWDRNGGSR